MPKNPCLYNLTRIPSVPETFIPNLRAKTLASSSSNRIVSKSDAKPDIDNNSPISGFDTENVGEKNSIVVKRGETLAEIIIRFYGKEDPKILDAVLKKNPEIKNPDLIFENQIIKLPAQP